MSGEITFEGWAIVELMGHRQRGGYVKDVEMFGGKLLRVDIPTDSGDVTEFYGCSAVYALRPTTEEIARQFVKRSYDDPRPIRPVDYKPAEERRSLGAPPGERPEEGDDDPAYSEDEEAA